MFVSQKLMNLTYCIFLAVIVILLFVVLSRQPIHIHLTSEEVKRELCKGYGKEFRNDKEKAGKKETSEH